MNAVNTLSVYTCVTVNTGARNILVSRHRKLRWCLWWQICRTNSTRKERQSNGIDKLERRFRGACQNRQNLQLWSAFRLSPFSRPRVWRFGPQDFGQRSTRASTTAVKWRHGCSNCSLRREVIRLSIVEPPVAGRRMPAGA